MVNESSDVAVAGTGDEINDEARNALLQTLTADGLSKPIPSLCFLLLSPVEFFLEYDRHLRVLSELKRRGAPYFELLYDKKPPSDDLPRLAYGHPIVQAAIDEINDGEMDGRKVDGEYLTRTYDFLIWAACASRQYKRLNLYLSDDTQEYLREELDARKEAECEETNGPVALVLGEAVENSTAIMKTDRDAEADCSFLERAGGWEIRYEGEQMLVRDTKGARIVHELLSNPSIPIDSVSLAGLDRDRLDAELESFDSRSQEDYRRRLKEIGRERGQAIKDGDKARDDELDQECDQIEEQLTKNQSKSGKSRWIGGTRSRAAKSVQANVRRFITSVDTPRWDLAIHLDNSIRTGAECVYSPETGINWQL